MSETLQDSLNGPILRDVGLGERLYIVMAYNYYMIDRPLVPDAYFDGLAKYLLENDSCLEFLDRDTLSAGTYLGGYPEWASFEPVVYDSRIFNTWGSYDEYLHENVDSVFI